MTSPRCRIRALTRVPDANRQHLYGGQDFKIWRFTLSIAYNYILSEARTKNNTIVTNGFRPPYKPTGGIAVMSTRWG